MSPNRFHERQAKELALATGTPVKVALAVLKCNYKIWEGRANEEILALTASALLKSRVTRKLVSEGLDVIRAMLLVEESARKLQRDVTFKYTTPSDLSDNIEKLCLQALPVIQRGLNN